MEGDKKVLLLDCLLTVPGAINVNPARRVNAVCRSWSMFTGTTGRSKINTACIYGYFSAVTSFNYNAAKAAVVAMSRSAALEYAPHNIRVVGVAPGFIDTPILDELDDAAKTYLGRQDMRGKLIQPKAVAQVVRFLFSPEADAINGSTISVDDGFLCFK